MNYADIKQYDVANGIGVRVSLFVSGCTHGCEGCFNKEAWDFEYGNPFTEKEIEDIIEYMKPSYVAGLTLLGGEPMEPQNQEGILPLLRRVHEEYPEKNIWMYTGYLFDEDILDRMCKESDISKEIISYIDILVDGEFILARKNLKVNFRGSDNQRIIDVKKSLEAGEVVHWEGEKT
ncbi:MAG: anaerobic ribonucleoside-triphosphate reductase activating protein [Eubacterium sp.]|nr:anaerobic ribonucleoside-triphosphate reductase activating protein [Eubacterium sp.]